MRDAFRDVIAFEVAAGHELTSEGPAVASEESARLRLKLLKEEYEETTEAIMAVVIRLQCGMDCGERRMADIADGLADLIWVALGTAIRFGIDLPAVWEAVRAANMAKFGPGSHRREDGKILKPPGWTAPNIEGVLAARRPLAESYGGPAEQRPTDAEIEDAAKSYCQFITGSRRGALRLDGRHVTSMNTTRPLQAIQFNGIDDYRKVVEWMRSLGITTADECRFSTPEMSIQTALGTESARPGDWIVRGPDGQFHVRRSHVLLTSATCPCRHRPDEEARDPDRPTRCLVCDGGLAICALWSTTIHPSHL